MKDQSTNTYYKMNWDDKRITLNNRIYKLYFANGLFDLLSLHTGKKIKPMTQEQLDAAYASGKIRDIF